MRNSFIQFKEKKITLNFCDALTVFRNDHVTVMLKGKAYLKNKGLTVEGIAREVVSRGVYNVINELTGIFCAFIFHENYIYMGRSMHSGPQLFYHINGDALYIADKISELIKLPGFTGSLNLRVAQKYLNGCRNNDNNSFITGVHKINNGEFVKFDYQLSSTSVIDEFCIKKKNDSVIDNVISNIEMTHENRDITLLFSGGFDSSLVFHALKELGFMFRACYYVSEYSDDSEMEFARRYCLKYDVEFAAINKKIDFNEEHYYELNPDVPDEIPLAPELSCESEESYGLKSENVFLICGHGGDHIFGQNPSVLFGLDALRKHGIKTMHKKMVEYSCLKGLKYKDIFIKNMAALRQKPAMYTLAKDEHISTMRLASAQFFSVDIRNKVNIFTPFLFKNIVQHHVSLPVYELFNQQYDRYPMRFEAFSRYGSDIFWKKSKRSSSQLIFRILSEKCENIANAIEQSGLADAMNINHSELSKDLYENTRVLLTDRLPYLISLYRLAKYMQIHRINI